MLQTNSFKKLKIEHNFGKTLYFQTTYKEASINLTLSGERYPGYQWKSNKNLLRNSRYRLARVSGKTFWLIFAS